MLFHGDSACGGELEEGIDEENILKIPPMLAIVHGDRAFLMRSAMALRFKRIRSIYHRTCRSLHYGQNASKYGTAANPIHLDEFSFDLNDLQ
jgi:hypothetical protein